MLTREEQRAIDSAYHEVRRINIETRISNIAAKMDMKRREQKQTRAGHFANGYEVKASGRNQNVTVRQVPMNVPEPKNRNEKTVSADYEQARGIRCHLFA